MDIEANETFHAFRVGFTHGAGGHGMLSEYKGRSQNYHDYLRGWEHGRNVWTAAMEEERARLGLPPAKMLRPAESRS